MGGFLAGWMLLAANFAFAQDARDARDITPAGTASAADAITPENLVAHYPAGSIQSADMANRALAEVELQRAALEQRYAAQEHVCYSKFLATSCLDAAKESRRLALAQIRTVEVEANSFIRSARVVERDQHLAEKRANEASNLPKPIAAPSARQAAAPEVAHSGDGEQRIARHQAKLRRAQQAEKDNAQMRAEEVAAFEKKAKDSAARQRNVAAKKADKERQAAAKSAAASAAASIAAPAAKP